ncbi:hypothetical protein [Kitasatospora sp. NPDC085879]|uniref:hypothetical protein n=1 Tax=Kitasatospora sp. NPDC085879 TaxID=3154769 RepID=UPI000BB136C8|nr:hypothetical protein [Streptomyces sp. TLI_235]
MGTVEDEHGTVEAAIAWLERRLPGVRTRREDLERELAEAVREEQALHGALDGLRALTTAWSGESAGDLGVAPRTVPPAAGPQPDDPATVAPAPDAAARDDTAEERLAPATTEAELGQPAPAAGEDEPVTVPAGEQRDGTASRPAKRTAARKAPAKKSAAGKTTVRKSQAKAAAGKPAHGVKQGTGGRSAARGAAEAAGPAPVAPTTAKPTRPARKSATAARTRGAAPDTAPTRSRRSRTSSDSVLEALAAAAGPLRARDVVDVLGLEAGATDAMRTTLERLAKRGLARRVARGTYTTAEKA